LRRGDHLLATFKSIRTTSWRLRRTALLIALVFGLSASPALAQAADPDMLASRFLHPPDSAKPLAYWWWLNGHTDLATITSDLEAMRAEGYGGAILMDANGADQNGNRPVTPGPTFASAPWQQLFLHTLKEAARLNLRISLTIQSGWNLGGPSVPPEQSTKLLTWTRKTVHGPRSASLQLDQPPTRNGFYRDIALLAYPLRHGATLASDPDNTRLPIRDLPVKAVFVEAGMSTPDSKPLLRDSPEDPAEADFDLSQEADLTSTMAPDGSVSWQVPTGDWELLRIGYTSSDARVSTSSGAWQGLVIDYMDRDALTAYWNRNIQPMLDAARPWLGVSLTNVYTDSWEVGGVNWTGRFREVFTASRGYDPVPWLPIVAGRIVTSRDAGDRFLNDFRRTIGDLVLSDHYQVFGQLAAGNGLGFHPESGGPHGAPIDALRLLGAGTFPQTEFWAPSNVHRTTDLDRFFVKEASSAAHIYLKTLVAGEGMTSIGPEWDESLGSDLKPTFDQAVCEGLNLMVWHTFTSSPAATGLPGQEYFAGTHLNPKVTWFRDGKAFFDYMGRVQFLMQQGLPVSDVLYYYGDQVPNFVQTKWTDPAHVLPGYDYDVIDEDVLTTGLRVENDRIRLANGTEYRELVLPPLDNISLRALKAVERLVNQGATVVGAKPTRLTGLPTTSQTDADVAVIADRLWAGCGANGSNSTTVGAGKIVCAESARHALADAGIAPDLSVSAPARDEDFDYVHRRAGTTEIYFVRNRKPAALTTVVTFRVRGLAPEFWNPETGATIPLDLYAETSDGLTSVPVSFDPYGSAIVVFRTPAGPHIVRLERDGRELFPTPPSGAPPVSIEIAQTGNTLLADQPGRYIATGESGRRFTATVAESQILPVKTPWTLSFPPGWGAPSEIRLAKLDSWTKSQTEGIRCFSGTATYSTQFDLPAQLPAHASIQVDFGDVRETARVSLNGKEVGVLWKNPFTIDVTSAAVPGTNALSIQVTNLWPNRLIGDQSLPQDKRFTQTNITKFTAKSPLLPSGLLGPVSVTVNRWVPMEPADAKP
jgi:hypothetical protein